MSTDNDDNDKDGLLGWCALRPIVLPASDYFLQMLIENGNARVVTNDHHVQGPEALVVQPRYEYINDPWPLAKIEVKGLAEHIAAVEAKNATKH